MSQHICVNQVFRDSSTDSRYRVVWTDPSQDLVYVFRLGSENGFPIPESLSDMEKAVSEERIEASEDNAMTESPTEKDLEKRDAIWKMMGDALTSEPDIYDQRKRTAMLDEISTRYNVPKNNLYRHLRRYWERGKTKDAFLPIHTRGRKRAVLSNHKRGPKSLKSDRGIDLTEQDNRNMDRTIRSCYLTRQEPTLMQAYNKMLSDYYSIRTPQENGTVSISFLPEEELPSFYQFRYYYRTHFKANEVVRKRKGDREYELNHTSTLHHADTAVTGPGSDYQVDATIADIYLVSAFNRAEIIGRPVLYFVIDVFSRMAVGMYIGLEGPSWTGMMMALYNACTDKAAYCREYGLEIEEKDWPCHHVPDSITGDRGELLSHSADTLVESLGIRINNTPPYRGDLKPYVERYFKLVDGYTSIVIPGKVRPDMKERGGPDYRLDAKLTLYEFTRIMIRIVVDYNTHKVLENYEPDEQILRSGVDLIPVQLWNWGICNCGRLRILPEEKIRFALMPKEKGSITEDGVRFRKLFYTCEAFEEMDLFALAKKKGAQKVQVSYDPRNRGRIYVWRNGEDTPYLCRLLDWEDKYCGKSDDEVRHEFLRQDRRKSELKRIEQESGASVDEFIQREVDAASAEYAASVPEMNRAERLKNMKANREAAKQELRDKEAFTGDRYTIEGTDHSTQDAGAARGQNTAEEKTSPQMEMIRAQVRERLQKMHEQEAQPDEEDPGGAV